MKKKQFRISLFNEANATCKSIAILAASSNGDGKKLTIDNLIAVADGNFIEYPVLNEGFFYNKVGDNSLTIDYKKPSGEVVCALAIEEVEIFELVEEEV